MGESRKDLLWKVKSAAVYYFLDKYNIMEELVKKLFQISVNKSSIEEKKRIFFLAGSQGKTHICVNERKMSIEMDPLYFDEIKSLINFNLTQIIKINDVTEIMPMLNHEIDLIQNRITKVKLCSCIKLLGSMRNKLVHTTERAKFKQGDIVEQLSVTNIIGTSVGWLLDGYIDVVDDVAISILSNAVYQDEVIRILNF